MQQYDMRSIIDSLGTASIDEDDENHIAENDPPPLMSMRVAAVEIIDKAQALIERIDAIVTASDGDGADDDADEMLTENPKPNGEKPTSAARCGKGSTIAPKPPLSLAQARRRAERDTKRNEQIRNIQSTANERVGAIRSKIGK